MNTKNALIPFAKINNKDVKTISKSLQKAKIHFEFHPAESENKQLLEIDATQKDKAQKVLDSLFSNKPKSTKPSFWGEMDWNKKFILFAIAFILWTIFKQYLKFSATP